MIFERKGIKTENWVSRAGIIQLYRSIPADFSLDERFNPYPLLSPDNMDSWQRTLFPFVYVANVSRKYRGLDLAGLNTLLIANNFELVTFCGVDELVHDEYLHKVNPSARSAIPEVVDIYFPTGKLFEAYYDDS